LTIGLTEGEDEDGEEPYSGEERYEWYSSEEV
jgi:hypothetical protein